MSDKGDTVQSIARAALLLRTLSTFGVLGAALGEIATLSQLPKPTVHRTLAALIDERLVERPPGSRRYRLGPDIMSFGIPVRDAFDLSKQCRPSLSRLSAATQATVYLGVRCGYDMLCLDKIDGMAPHAAGLLQLHDRWPLGIGAFSLALLAFLPASDIDDVIAYNQRRVQAAETRTFEQSHQSIAKTRRHGIAKRSTRGSQGVTGLAVPILDERGYPVASICVVAKASLMNPSMIADWGRLLKDEAAILARLHERASQQQRAQAEERWRQAIRGS